MAHSRLPLERTVARTRNFAPFRPRTSADETRAARAGETHDGHDPGGARTALRAFGPTGSRSRSAHKNRTVVFESRNEARSAGSICAGSAAATTGANRGDWSNRAESPGDCRYVSLVGAVVVSTHVEPHQAATRRAVLVDCLARAAQAADLSRGAVA